MSELIGQTIGNCRIDALLGKGGMGRVYRAHHIKLDRPEAVKVLLDAVAQDSSFQARFRLEARVVAALSHPNIVEIYEFDEYNGRFYLRMELLPDGSLRTLLERRANEGRTTLPIDFALDLVRQAADALAYAHERGIIHRDIKPDNLLLLRRRTDSGSSVYTLKVSDFGLARLAEGSGLTSAGITVGTPAYMSPEQCQGIDLDARSDIYALGVVLYEVMTGYRPFSARTISEAVRKHVQEQPLPPRQSRAELPAEVEAVILRCLAKRPEERFASAAELSAALRGLIGAGAVPQQPTPPEVALVPQVRVHDAQGRALRVARLTPAGLTAGRLAGNDLLLDDQAVGRNHLRIDWSGRRARVTDLGSRGGTRLAGQPLTPHTPQVWPIEQTLQVGPFTLGLELADPAADRVAVTFASGQEALTLTPGTPAFVQVKLANQGPNAALTVTVDGIPAHWVQLPNYPLELASGAQITLALTIEIPATPEGAAGDYPIVVRARGRDDGAELGAARARWSVARCAGGHIEIVPEQGQGREQADYTVRLTNDGNATARYTLSAADPNQALSVRLDRTEVELVPGQTAEIALAVQVGRRLLGASRRHQVTVRAVAGDETCEATAQFIQTALVGSWITPAG